MDPPCTDRVTHGPDDPDPPTCGGDSAFSGMRFSTAYGVACSKLFRAALPSRSFLRKLGAVERPGRLWQRSSRSSSSAHCCEESAASDPSAIRTPASGTLPCNGTDGCEQRVRSHGHQRSVRRTHLTALTTAPPPRGLVRPTRSCPGVALRNVPPDGVVIAHRPSVAADSVRVCTDDTAPHWTRRAPGRPAVRQRRTSHF